MQRTTFSKPIKDEEKFKSNIIQAFPDWKLKHVSFTQEIRLNKGKLTMQITLLKDQTKLITGLNMFDRGFLFTLAGIFAVIVLANEFILRDVNMYLPSYGVALLFLILLIALVFSYPKLYPSFESEQIEAHSQMEKIIKKMI